MNNLIAYIATALGLALVITGWFIWGDRTQMDFFVLNIVVSVVAYCVMFVDILIPWADLRDKTQRRIGNTGIRWFVQYGYSIVAILILVLCNLQGLSFSIYIMLQGGLLILLLLGIAISLTTAKKISEVSQQNSIVVDCVRQMRKNHNAMSEAAYSASAPQMVIDQINQLGEDLRFISPSNSEESHDIEDDINEVFAETETLFRNYELNRERIDANLGKASRLIKKRKSTYSN